MSDRFHAFHGERKCACGRPRRPSGKDCLSCHATAQRAYRARRAEERRQADPLAALIRKHTRQSA